VDPLVRTIHHGAMSAHFPDDGIYQYAPCGVYLRPGSSDRSNIWLHEGPEELPPDLPASEP
jgi:hypothetical protein